MQATVTLPELLRKRRKSLGLTRREISAACGAIERTVVNWEMGHALPKAKFFAGICRAYQIERPVLLDAIRASQA